MEVVEEQQMLAAEEHFTLDLVDPPDSPLLRQSGSEGGERIFLELAGGRIPPTGSPNLLDTWFTLQGDWNQLVRLFTNLIGNAVQYTPPGGKASSYRTAIGRESLLPNPPLRADRG